MSNESGWGGAREGAGRPQGSLSQSTLRKKAIRERWLKRFEEDADLFYDAQRAQALGTKYLVTRDPKSGKFVPLNEEQTKLMLESGQADRLEVWDRPPSSQAFVAIADRVIDKPTEHLEHSGPDGGPIEIGVAGRLEQARKRVSAK